MTKEQEEKYNAWSKMDIYKAYLLENELREKLNRELNQERLKNKTLKHSLKELIKS